MAKTPKKEVIGDEPAPTPQGDQFVIGKASLRTSLVDNKLLFKITITLCSREN